MDQDIPEETITALDKEIDEILASLDSGDPGADNTADALADVDLDDLF